jgi:hypothetical protein
VDQVHCARARTNLMRMRPFGVRVVAEESAGALGAITLPRRRRPRHATVKKQVERRMSLSGGSHVLLARCESHSERDAR